MDRLAYENLEIIWDYMHLHMEPRPADCIVGFGNYNTAIALRAAELYHQKLAPKILFSGGLGRNTDGRWSGSEAARFRDIAVGEGVSREDIILEDRSTNTAENILFTRKKFEALGMEVKTILGVHQPFMERRIYAALKIYWPELDAVITSPNTSTEGYLQVAAAQGLDEKTAVEVVVGDFQRIDVYAKKGYQIPQFVPGEVNEAFRTLVDLGYDGQLVS